MRVAERVYNLQSDGASGYVIVEVDDARTREAAPIVVAPSSVTMSATPSDAPFIDPPDLIDVLGIYTGSARAAAGGASAVEARIVLAIENTNLALTNSQVRHRMRLVHRAEVSYTESGNSLNELSRLNNPNDGYLDEVPTLRNAHGADLVVMVVSTMEAGFSGRAFQLNSRTPSVGVGGARTA